MARNSNTKIWKLQRPIVTNGNYNEIMAYPEDRSTTALIPLDEKTINELFGDELKIYVRGYVKDGNLNIDRKVSERDW